MASLIFNWKLVEAESRILKQSSEQREKQPASQHQIYYGEGRKPEAPLLRCAFR